MSDDSTIKLHVLDVGHGDSLIIEFPDGIHHAIIDCHTHAESNRGFGLPYDRCTPKALLYFEKLIAKDLSPIVEFACLTHPHIDHYRGYATMLERLVNIGVPIRSYWDFGASARKAESMRRVAQDDPEANEIASELERLCEVQLKLIERLGCHYAILATPMRDFWCKHGVSVDVVAPSANHVQRYFNYLACPTDADKRAFARRFPHAADDNTISSAILMRYGCFRLLLGGDVTSAGWSAIVGSMDSIDPSCLAIKVSHHGSTHGNFLPDKSPLWPLVKRGQESLTAVISGGYRPGLPHEVTVSSLRREGCRAFCTGSLKAQSCKIYRPAAADEDVATQLMLEGVCEIEDRLESGHGNITLSCSASGVCRVICEMESAEQKIRS